MGRPRKKTQAARSNGALAKNKGKVVKGEEELYGTFLKNGTYVVQAFPQRVHVGKGTFIRRDDGWEFDVVTYCLYHGKFVRFDGDQADSEFDRQQRLCTKQVDYDRWVAAEKLARKLIGGWRGTPAAEKMAILAKRTRCAKVRIEFVRGKKRCSRK